MKRDIETIVREAFDLQDWLAGTKSGGIEAPRILIRMETVSEHTVSVTWKNPETCGLSDCRYHNTDLDEHTDFFTLINDKLIMNADDVFQVNGWEDDPDIMDKINEFSQKYGLQLIGMRVYLTTYDGYYICVKDDNISSYEGKALLPPDVLKWLKTHDPVEIHAFCKDAIAYGYCK